MADIIVAPPVVEHHSTHQRRDLRGRFSRTSNARPRRRTTTNRSRRQAVEEPADLLALLQYPFYPLFILDNGMNSISESLTVLTPA